jgi:hypothetical protein
MDIETGDDRNDDEIPAHIVSRTVVQRTTYPTSTTAAPESTTTTSDDVFVRHNTSGASEHEQDNGLDHPSLYIRPRDDRTMNDQSSFSRRYSSTDQSSSSAKLNHNPAESTSLLLDNSSGRLDSLDGTHKDPLKSP